MVTLAELAKLISAQLQAGEPESIILSAAALEEAQPGSISFAEGPKQLNALKNTRASAVVLTAELAPNCPGAALIVANPRRAFAQLLRVLYPNPKAPLGVHPSAVIAEGVVVPASASIGPGVVIGERVSLGEGVVIGAGVSIGADCVLGAETQLAPRVTLYSRVTVGERVMIHSGAVIGADGFGYEPNADGSWFKTYQVGGVRIGNDVEIGANTTIDRGALSDTVIGNGVKLDNLIMIAHNVSIGEHTIIAGCTGIAGSVKIGRRCMIGGHCAITGHIELADGVILTGDSMVTRSLSQAGVYSSGTGVLPNKAWLKAAVRFRQLDEMHARLQQLEREVYEP
jgi:UDP-3-O-[3-hydroxymyristoyl] glucosamine N-acyltransferase